MKDEVEEFLRRVAQLRAQAEAQARGQQQRPAFQPPPPPQRMVPPPRLVPTQDEVVYLEPADAEVVDAELAELGDSVGRHVAQHLRGDREIAEQTRHLGEEVDLADEKLESHLHQVFDHRLGNLKKSASETAAVSHAHLALDVNMGEIRNLLASSASVRNAIIMTEILRRPEERW